jgi:hypothetical protein
VGVPWPLVDVLEEGCDGILLALGFSLDLKQSCQFIVARFPFLCWLSFLFSLLIRESTEIDTLLLSVFRTQPVSLCSRA